MTFQPIELMNIEGFLPVIINIVPVPNNNIPLFLGLALPGDKDNKGSTVGSVFERNPADYKERFETDRVEQISYLN